ncbi:chondroitinase-B domain-containing protein [Prolixibacteraceae bacterium]|nr:chondroitinase-B domain-containing protein [Prolixibacteraceae bacterium]
MRKTTFTSKALARRLLFLTACVSIFSCSMKDKKGTSSIALDQLHKVLEQKVDCDTIYIKDGVYADLSLTISQSGNTKQNLVIKADNAGKVKVTGRSKVSIKGSYVVLSGIFFETPITASANDKLGAVIDIFGDHNRITECTFFRCHNRASISSLYIKEEDRMPKYHRIDHCYFADNFGWRLYLDLGQRVPSDDFKYAMYHRIDHNYFSTPYKFGANTGSSMRIGLGQYGYGRCMIDNNLFERQNGEAELIENKSHQNIYIHNTFKNCESNMSFRQGHQAIFLQNYLFATDPKRRCGGLSMWMDRHIVAGNYFSFPYGSFVRLDKKMNIKTNELPASVVRFNSGCKNFMENGNPVGHYAANHVTFINNLMYNNKDYLFDFSFGYAHMKERYEQKTGIEVAGASNSLIKNNHFEKKCGDKETLFIDKSNKHSQTFQFVENVFEAYDGTSVANNPPLKDELKAEDDILKVKEWMPNIASLHERSFGLVMLMNNCVAQVKRIDGQKNEIKFNKFNPLTFNEVGPKWLKENPSTFAQDGVMTETLKAEILKNINRQ